ncbi:MAG: hypothetical protein ACLFVU_01945 [Phycisphaerae bacterium]
MALKAKLTKGELEELPEALQEYYKADGDDFVLDLDGVDDHPTVKGLKSKLDEVLGETKAEREKRKALEQAQTEAERKAAEEKGEFEKLYKQAQDELEAERKQSRQFREQITQRDIKGSAQELARQLAPSDPKRADVLADYASRYAKFEDGQVSFEMGGVKVEPTKVAEHLSKEYPFLVDGSQASGGGASGSERGGAAGKTITRADFDSMSHPERQSFFKDGGKISDDD